MLKNMFWTTTPSGIWANKMYAKMEVTIMANATGIEVRIITTIKIIAKTPSTQITSLSRGENAFLKVKFPLNLKFLKGGTADLMF
jgi:hypothetical protein